MVQGLKTDIEPKQLVGLRDLLLALHTELLNFQRQRYEEENTKIRTPSEYFSLVTQHPQFQWLRTLSALIVSVDEVISSKSETNTEQLSDLLKYVGSILTPAEDGSEFERRYHEALQKSPTAGLAHSKAVQELVNLEK